MICIMPEHDLMMVNVVMVMVNVVVVLVVVLVVVTTDERDQTVCWSESLNA